MKKFFILFIIFVCTGVVFAMDVPVKKYGNIPQGTFRKNRNGDFVQYDKNGKKIGVYRISKGMYLKVK